MPDAADWLDPWMLSGTWLAAYNAYVGVFEDDPPEWLLTLTNPVMVLSWPTRQEVQARLDDARTRIGPMLAAPVHTWPPGDVLGWPDNATTPFDLGSDLWYVINSAVAVEEIRARIGAHRVLIAAERYRRARGQLPMSIADLIPSYLDAAPIDPWSGQPLVYSARGGEALVYSVGPDGEDDGGIQWADPPPDPDQGLRAHRGQPRAVLDGDLVFDQH